MKKRITLFPTKTQSSSPSKQKSMDTPTWPNDVPIGTEGEKEALPVPPPKAWVSSTGTVMHSAGDPQHHDLLGIQSQDQSSMRRGRFYILFSLLCPISVYIFYLFLLSIMQHFLELLRTSIAFPSVSTDATFRSSVEACGARLLNELHTHGFETQSITGFGNPLIYGYYEVDPALPTYLVYGHYDVQPAVIEDGRTSDPFVLRDDGERLYARGVADNKGQHLIHLATIFSLIQNHQLACNIKVLIEGDEETGSPYMVQFFEQYASLLACDGVIISDGEIIGHDVPTMTQSFRGGANMTLTIATAKTDVHSGMYGNVLPSASHTLITLLSKLYDASGLIAVPGRYDSVATISEETRTNNLTIPFDAQALFDATGCKALVTPDGYDPVTANGLLPTIQVSGLSSGYTNTGYKNIIPAKAIAKMNFRFAPGQDANQMISLFTKWVEETLPAYASFTLQTSDPYNAIALEIDSARTQTCREALAQAYGKPVIMRHCGAAVPISGLFQTYVGCPVAVVDFANEDCNMHGIDENFRIENIEKGLACSALLFGKPPL